MPYSEKQIAEWADNVCSFMATACGSAQEVLLAQTRTLIAAVRKEMREECEKEMGLKIYHACAQHQHLPVWIPSASTFIPMIVCPHCEAAIRNLQEREEGKT